MSIEISPIQTSSLPLKEKILIEVWGVVQNTIFRYSPRRGNRFRAFILQMFGAKITGRVAISNKARIHCPWNLIMGERASLGEYSWIYSLDKIKIGEYSCIGQHVWLITGSHDITDPIFPLITKPIEIGYGCWLSAGAKILPGVKIEDLAVVGACSVVTRNVERCSVVAGNPAKFIKKRELKGK